MSITVITLTRRRIELLQRAISSIELQDITIPIKHLIVVDDCLETLSFLETIQPHKPHLQTIFSKRSTDDISGSQRCSTLRNWAVRQAKANWIAFLDDDNTFAPNHLSTLLDCARSSGVRAVHSHRKLLNSNGTPFLDTRFPWCRDQNQAQLVYTELVAKGVFSLGSNIVKDRVDPIDSENGVQMVDTGEWLLSRELLLEIPFPESYSTLDQENVVTEDDKLLQSLVSYDEPIGCSFIASLNYYLGGYSNSF